MKEGIAKHKGPKLEELENSPSRTIRTVKHEEACSGENTRGVAGHCFMK